MRETEGVHTCAGSMATLWSEVVLWGCWFVAVCQSSRHWFMVCFPYFFVSVTCTQRNSSLTALPWPSPSRFIFSSQQHVCLSICLPSPVIYFKQVEMGKQKSGTSESKCWSGEGQIDYSRKVREDSCPVRGPGSYRCQQHVPDS